MRILIDTNVFISAESMDDAHVDEFAESAAQLYRLAMDGRHQVLMSQESKDDLARQASGARRAMRERQFGKYATIERIAFPDGFAARAGYSEPLSGNDRVDLSLLLAVHRRAADYLVTQDGRLLRHAEALGVADQVLPLQDMIAVLSSELSPALSLPSVEQVPGYQLDQEDPFFDSLKGAYGPKAFLEWLRDKVQRGARDCLRITGPSGRLDGLMILKPETVTPYGLTGNVLKICTFKIAEHALGHKRGELLLKSVFQYARDRQVDSLFVEVFEQQAQMLSLLEDFGFKALNARTSRNEVVLAKPLRAETRDQTGMSALDFHRRYGPPAVKVEQAFVVPIEPRWHDRLFPEAALQPELFPAGTRSYGNALKKAYLSHAKTNQLQPGATLLFYRSHQAQAVTVIGVVECTTRSSDPTVILQAVGTRTVYSPEEVDAMCRRGPVLATLFRQDRVLSEPWTRSRLLRERVITFAPQSTVRIGPTGLAWVQRQLPV